MREKEELKIAMLVARCLAPSLELVWEMSHDGSTLLTEGNRRSENTWIMELGDSKRGLEVWQEKGSRQEKRKREWFQTASYNRVCRLEAPQFQRMADLSKDCQMKKEVAKHHSRTSAGMRHWLQRWDLQSEKILTSLCRNHDYATYLTRSRY